MFNVSWLPFWLGIVSGIFLASGSGLVPPFQWIERLGLPADGHLIVGLILVCFTWMAHIFFAGGQFWPFEIPSARSKTEKTPLQ